MFNVDEMRSELTHIETRVKNAYRWMQKEPDIDKIKKFYPVAEKLIERRGVLRQRIENLERIKHAGK